MSKSAVPHNPVQLRAIAETHLHGGTAPLHTGATGADALTLLHRLASLPASAGDALKLLHELQVHQVELDLQREEMERSQLELREELERYTNLFAFAPFGYFSVGPNDRIIDGNIAGANLFGIDRSALWGRRIDDFLSETSRSLLLGMLRRRRSSEMGPKERCEVYAEVPAQTLTIGDMLNREHKRETRLQTLQAAANLIPGSQCLLVTFMELD